MTTPAVDQTYGQRSVFGVPGQTATAPIDDDLECEDEHDALAYLMLVRSEASKIPNVMVAPRPGPQAFPPGFAEAKEKKAEKKEDLREARRKRNKRRQRHWDDQDDRPGVSSTADYDGAKRQRTELSYDEVSYDDLYDERPEVKDLKEEKEDGNGDSKENEEEQSEDEDDKEDDEEDEKDDASNYNRQALYETGVGDARGFYHDGAYVAAGDDSADSADSAAAETADAAETDAAFSIAYRQRLLAHFADMRAHFAFLADNTYGGENTDVGPLSVRSGVFKHWLHILRTADPRPEQVAAMDKISVLRLLRILQRGLEAGASTSSRSSRAGRFVRSLAGGPGQGQLDMSPRTIRWLWALFSRLPGRGELDYREIGYVRDVAKQAVMRLAHLSYDMNGVDAGGEADEEEYDYEGEEGKEEEKEEGEAHTDAENHENHKNHEDGNAAENHELDAEDIAMDIDSEPEDDKEKPSKVEAAVEAEDATDAGLETQQRAALEMVLAVAGEFYGQRDLLAFRSPWAVPSKSS